MNRLLRSVLCLLVLLVSAGLFAEKVSDLPKPTAYVSDFAGVLDQATKQRVEAMCLQLDQQTHAQLAVVTIKKLEDDQTIEEFAVALEEKWKVGRKGTDNGLLMVLSMDPRKIRVEVGYGLEGVLNDAKVGAILDTMEPALKANNFNQAIPLGVQQLAQDVAADQNIALAPPAPVQHQYRRAPAQPQKLGLSQIIVGIVFVLILILLVSTGNIGWLFVILNMFLGGGGGGGRDDDRGGGGGFGGFGGGSSGGGGSSRDF